MREAWGAGQLAVGLACGPRLRISAVTRADDGHVGGHVDSRRRRRPRRQSGWAVRPSPLRQPPPLLELETLGVME